MFLSAVMRRFRGGSACIFARSGSEPRPVCQVTPARRCNPTLQEIILVTNMDMSV